MQFRRIHGDCARDDEIEARERAIRSLVEDRIQAAMEAGAFDNLPGKGRPLKLEENPFVPPELRLAYKVLADANFAPDWIELDKKVRAAREELKALQERHVTWLRRKADDARSPGASHPGAPPAHVSHPDVPPHDVPPRDVIAQHRRARAELEKRLAEINRAIDELNLIVPQLSLQRPRLPVNDILAEFDAACRQAYPGLRA